MKAFFCAFLVMAMGAEQSNPLARYQWSNRLIVIVSGEEPTMAGEQYARFANDSEGILERDLLLFVIEGNRVRANGETTIFETQEILQAYNLNPNEFAILLIGKDGGVKYRSGKMVTTSDVYGLIDQMPMRRAEMRSRGD